MIITTSGFVKRLDFSEKFCNFSRYHHTFGKNSVTYNADVATYSDFEIVALHRKNEVGDTVNSAIDSSHLSDLFNIFQWLFNEANGGVLTANEEVVNNELASRFGSASVELEVDTMITDVSGNILPNKLTIRYTVDDDIFLYEFWLNSSNIDNEYTQYDVVILPPVDEVDYLVDDKATVLALINSRTINDYNTSINNIAKESPYTAVVSLQTQWVNRNNPTETLQINFTCVCFGPVEDNTSLLRIALRDYVEANTQFADTVWEVVLPEIFTATTFLMVPSWDKVSNGVGESSIYNPILSTKQISDVFKNSFTGYDTTHVDENFEVLPCMWQSLSIGVCGAPKNEDEYKSISFSLDDYILTDPNGNDFIRLNPTTRDFILKLNNTLPYAQSYTVNDPLPGTVEAEVIDGFNFLVFTSYNIKCKIMSKADYLTLIGA